MMKLGKIYIFAAAVAMFFVQGCTNDVLDLREKDYGYVQFKLYKRASYEPVTPASRAADDELDFLAEAFKVEVAIATEGGRKLRQTLVLSSSDKESAEFGLRSDKLKLLAGKYSLEQVKLFDALDNEIYNKLVDADGEFTVGVGGLTIRDVLVDVVERGKVKFSLVKDFSDFNEIPTRSEREKQYTFDEIKVVTLTVQKLNSKGEPFGRPIEFEKLPAKFTQHFDEDDVQSSTPGHKTSSIECDTLLSLEAAKYRVMSYTTYASKKDIVPLEVNNSLVAPASQPDKFDFVITDNETTDAKVWVKLYEADEYIKDNYALYAIWKSLDGENWCYDGEEYQRGTNWDFNKDVDLWCEQPGVQVHSNGRIARIDLSNFGFKGKMSKEIGQLTELMELYLGTHNDTNNMYDPSLDSKRSLAERQRTLVDDQRAYLRSIHPGIQMSEPCARALKEKNLTSPAIALYELGEKESEIIDKKSGMQTIRKYDMNWGVLKNGLEELPAEIGNLKKLEILNIANSPIEKIPAEIAQCESLSSIEIYNCPNMTEFPVEIGRLPKLRQVNISNNKQWSSDEIAEGFKALATGAARKEIEILYARENNLSKLDRNWFGATRGGFEAMGLLDLSYNQIEGDIEGFGKEVAFIQLYLDNNKITGLKVAKEDGYFCGYDDIENFSVNFNKLTMIPNIFNSKAVYTMASVSFAGNEIGKDGIICEGEDKTGKEAYKGIKVNTLTLSMNPLKRYPKAFAESNSLFEYIIASACQIESFDEGSFSHEKAINHMSFDLSYNRLKELPKDFHAGNMPYLYGVDLSFNRFEKFPYYVLDAAGLTVLSLRSQRDELGERCLREWPEGIYQHVGLRGLYLGSNDLREVTETISTLCYYLDISDNPNITFDASDICYAWQTGAYILFYDKTQRILNCDAMLE